MPDVGRQTTCPHGWHVQRGEGCPEGPGCNEAGREPTGRYPCCDHCNHPGHRLVRDYHHEPCEAECAAEAGREASRSFVADVLHDCLSSFQGLDHSEGVCCFDRDAAVEYLLSPASGLSIRLEEESV